MRKGNNGLKLRWTMHYEEEEERRKKKRVLTDESSYSNVAAKWIIHLVSTYKDVALELHFGFTT